MNMLLGFGLFGLFDSKRHGKQFLARLYKVQVELL